MTVIEEQQQLHSRKSEAKHSVNQTTLQRNGIPCRVTNDSRNRELSLASGLREPNAAL
jgi:hypothetical protein